MEARHPSSGTVYRITVAGHLDRRWADWFGALTIETGSIDDEPVTVLIGPVQDQAALHGLLAKVRDLGLRIDQVDKLPPASEGYRPMEERR